MLGGRRPLPQLKTCRLCRQAKQRHESSICNRLFHQGDAMSRTSACKPSVNRFARRLAISTALPLALAIAGGVPSTFAATVTVTGTPGAEGANGICPGDPGGPGGPGGPADADAGSNTDTANTASAY